MSYDYVIVGAGSAGCVLANRLSEHEEASVLVLEAGGSDNRQEVTIPAANSELFRTDADWNYETESEPHLYGRRLYWPRGKILGGSSSINNMVYIRGNREDYDRWAELTNGEWSYRDVLPYFKRSEDAETGDPEYRGTGGPLRVETLRDPNPLSHAFVRAAQQKGYGLNDDFNAGEQEGFGLYQVTQRNGTRHSAADAFLHPAVDRPNLTVKTNALTLDIAIEGGRDYRRSLREGRRAPFRYG